MIVVFGGGRIGLSIARALARSNAEVAVVVRRPTPRPDLPPNVRWIEAPADLDWQVVTLAIVAFPLPKDPGSTLLRKLPAGIPVASVSASFSIAEHRQVLPGRAVTRFMCTPAIQTGDSLVFYDEGSDGEAVRALHRALPTLPWRAVPSNRFERFTLCIVAAPLVCRALHEFAEVLGVGDLREEKVFLAETLVEAKRMLEIEGYDPLAAFDRAATPGGLTREYFARALSARRHDLLAGEEEPEGPGDSDDEPERRVAGGR